MELIDYLDQIKLQLTGGVLESELDDESLKKIVNIALRELNRYYNSTKVVNIQLSNEGCVDLTKYPDINAVVNVFRTNGVGTASNVDSTTDPVMMSQLQLYNLGTGVTSTDWVRRIADYTLVQQISNTTSTDLAFREDKISKKLYINLPQGVPSELAVEYVPKLFDVSEVVSDYWIDILMRLSLAYAKISLGRIRTRFTQSNALWASDGDKILEEGNTELKELRELLRTQSDVLYPID